MGRRGEDLVPASLLDNAAEIHDGDAIAHVFHDAEIVRDHQQRHAEFVLQVQKQVDDLRPDGDVERRYRLVADDEFRFDDQRARNAEALPLAAFARAVAETAGDPGLLAARFGVPPLAVFRRLAGLPGSRMTGLVLCDGAGALTFRKPVEGFTLPRFGAGCPLWPLYQALSRPGSAIRATLEMAGRVPRRFLAYAFCQTGHPAGFDGPQVLEAGMLLLPAEAARSPGELPVGATCRICPRAECPARREPSILSDAA